MDGDCRDQAVLKADGTSLAWHNGQDLFRQERGARILREQLVREQGDGILLATVSFSLRPGTSRRLPASSL